MSRTVGRIMLLVGGLILLVVTAACGNKQPHYPRYQPTMVEIMGMAGCRAWLPVSNPVSPSTAEASATAANCQDSEYGLTGGITVDIFRSNTDRDRWIPGGRRIQEAMNGNPDKTNRLVVGNQWIITPDDSAMDADYLAMLTGAAAR